MNCTKSKQIPLPDKNIQDTVLKGEILIIKDKLEHFCKGKGLKLGNISFCPYEKMFRMTFNHCKDEDIKVTESIKLEDVNDLLLNKDELAVNFNNYIVNALEGLYNAIATAQAIIKSMGIIVVEDMDITEEKFNEMKIDFNKGELNKSLKSKTVIEGMGADAELTVNDKGGKQSKSPHAFHLVDPDFVRDLLEEYAEDTEHNNFYEAFVMGFDYMSEKDSNPRESKNTLFSMIERIEPVASDVISTVAKRMSYGAGRYAPNNWRLIPREEHLNHAMNHLFALALGDTQDDHKSAALCRLHMALSTLESDNFKYQEFVKVESKDLTDAEIGELLQNVDND